MRQLIWRPSKGTLQGRTFTVEYSRAEVRSLLSGNQVEDGNLASQLVRNDALTVFEGSPILGEMHNISYAGNERLYMQAAKAAVNGPPSTFCRDVYELYLGKYVAVRKY